MQQVLGVLDQPGQSAVVNLLAIPLADRPVFFEDLLAQVSAHATRTGLPHWLVLDEAHHLLPASMQTKAVGPLDQFGSLMLITVHPEAVDEAVLRTVNTVLAVGAGAADALAAVAGAGGKEAPEPQEPDLPSGRVALWRAHLGRVDVVDLTPPRGERQRHRRKYALGTMAPEESFYFRGPEERLNLRAHNLVLFLQIGNGLDDETWQHHRGQGDYSRWLADVIGDEELAADVADVERDDNLSVRDARERLRDLVRQKYTLADLPDTYHRPEG